MNYFFDKRFKVGLVVGVMLFVAVNVVSYQVARRRHEEFRGWSGPFSGGNGFDWGFPFAWQRDYLTSLDDGILNVAFCLILCTIVGIIFKLVKR